MSPVAAAFLSVGLVGLVSFAGAVGLAIGRKWLASTLILLVSFAAGALFGDVFIHLVPESFEAFDTSLVPSLLILGGILLFFVLEKFVHWHHCHNVDEMHEDEHKHKRLASMNLFGDGLHNFIDGLLIGAAYLVSLPVGIATTVAVVLHEIPSEIGDFGVLLHSGMSAKRALWFNFLSALTAVVGVIIALTVGSSIEGFAKYVLPLTAGAFVYIAGSDLIPELHSKNPTTSQAIWQLLALCAGIAVMAALTLVE